MPGPSLSILRDPRLFVMISAREPFHIGRRRFFLQRVKLMDTATSPQKPVIGWREWVSLPLLHIPRIKAKVDTGARSSSLHAFDVNYVQRRGKDFVRFTVHPFQRDTRTSIAAEAEVFEFRSVKSSSGHSTLRPVILTDVEVLGTRWTIELTLANRDEMGFRMLLGRQAIRNRFLVDAGHSYRNGRVEKKRRRKKNAKRRMNDKGGGSDGVIE